MKKRLAAILLAATLMLSAAACNNSGSQQSSTTPSTASSEPAASTAESSTPASQAEASEQQTSTEPEKQTVELEYWTDGSSVAQSIKDYVAQVTDPNSDKFIPVEDRIVVSDLDGTLMGELYPAYFDYCMFVHRALYDDNYKASEEMKAFAHELEEAFKTRTLPKGSETTHAAFAAEAYKGMTLEELDQYTRDFMKSEAEGFNNLTRGQAAYKPMASLVKYLRANDFTVYVVSGTDRMLVRALADEMFDIPSNQVIGTDTTMVATHQGDTDGLSYMYQADDELVFGGEYYKKNLKMNKVAVIAQEIGKVPVLALGNSSGDVSMAQYVVNNKKYEGRAYMLLCDDTEREYGKPETAASLKKTCEERGFYTVSMKDDFATIYGENVTLAKPAAEEQSSELAPAA